jgi:hypothetical protein
MEMVYEIRPRANRANRMVELQYRRSPTARSAWHDYIHKEQPVPREAVPLLILSEYNTPLPDAFEITRDVWCVSDKARDLMQRLFGDQVVFYEVPVAVEADNQPLPSTNFVTFSQFRALIDWQKSKVQQRRRAGSSPNIQAIDLAYAGAAVFKAMPSSQQMIWIERTLRDGDRLFSPGFNAYATDSAAEAIGQAFPGAFILRKHQENPSSAST